MPLPLDAAVSPLRVGPLVNPDKAGSRASKWMVVLQRSAHNERVLL